MPYPYSPEKSEMHTVNFNGKSHPVWEYGDLFYSTFDQAIIEAESKNEFEYYHATPDDKWSAGSSKDLAVMAAMFKYMHDEIGFKIQETNQESEKAIEKAMDYINREYRQKTDT